MAENTTSAPFDDTVDNPIAVGPPKPAPAVKPGLSPLTYGLAALAVACALWATWMTKTVSDLKDARAPFASVQLQPLIQEYVQAQSHTSTPEDQVTRETQAFMAALDGELKTLGKDGTTVLVAEAVLSADVPDITPVVRKAVYAKIPMPGTGLASSPALGGPSASVASNGLGG